MSANICWELTCDGLVSRLGGIKDSHPLNTTKTGDKRRLHGPLVKDLALAFPQVIVKATFLWDVAKMIDIKYR